MLRPKHVVPSLLAMLICACDKTEPTPSAADEHDSKDIEITLDPERAIRIHHPGEVPPVSVLWQEDSIIVNQNLGEDEAPFTIGGNIARVWFKTGQEGRIWIQRNSSDAELVAKTGDRSLYVDQNGDGIVDYKRNGDGVFRVAEIIWEKIGDIPEVPPDEPSIRIDTHRSLPMSQGDITPLQNKEKKQNKAEMATPRKPSD